MAATRSEAGLAIRAGSVAVAGRPIVKAGSLVAPDEAITRLAPPRRFVSRGGDKLDGALEAFGIHVEDRRALDAGASTGGFTHCLLERGAARVAAVDVGYGQLDWRLREDPRVAVMERTNVRALQPADLPFRPDLVTADLSFISLRLVLPALVRCAAADAEFVLLVKPQFEAGRAEVGRTGVVADPALWERAIREVAGVARAEGLTVLAVTASSLPGPAGNVEFFLHASSHRTGPPGAGDGFDGGLRRALASGAELRGTG